MIRNELNNFSTERRIKGKIDMKTFINVLSALIKFSSQLLNCEEFYFAKYIVYVSLFQIRVINSEIVKNITLQQKLKIYIDLFWNPNHRNVN